MARSLVCSCGKMDSKTNYGGSEGQAAVSESLFVRTPAQLSLAAKWYRQYEVYGSALGA